MMPSPLVAETSNRYRQLLDQTNCIVLSGAVEAFSECLRHFDDLLFDRAETAGSQQRNYIDGMNELRRQRNAIEGRYRAHLELALQSLVDGRPIAAEVILSGQWGSAESSLNLLSDQELEFRLAINQFANAITSKCKPVLVWLDDCLGQVSGIKDLDGETNPLSPRHIGAALHNAFLSCDLAAEVRLLLIKQCERELYEPLNRLYLTVENCLRDAGLKPIKQEVRHSDTASPRDSKRMRDEINKLLASLDHSELTEVPDWAKRFLGTPIQKDLAGNEETRMEDARNHLTGLFDALHHLLQVSRSDKNMPIDHAMHGMDYRALDQGEILSVLSRLQSMPSSLTEATVSEMDEPLSQRLKKEVINCAGQLGYDPNYAQLNPIDEDMIDLVSMMFTVLMDERDLPGKSRELICRLVVPFVKVAVLDRKMFIQKAHPARRLLNALAVACEGNSGQTPAEKNLMSKVEEIVERLLTEFNESLAIFSELENEFGAFLTQHHRRVEVAERRVAETQRGQEKLELARIQANTELMLRVGDTKPTLPHAFDAFLRLPWRHHLVLTILRETRDDKPEGAPPSQEVHEVLLIADQLLESVYRAQRREQKQNWLKPLHQQLYKVFASVGLFAEAATVAINALEETLHAVANARPDLERLLPEMHVHVEQTSESLDHSLFDYDDETPLQGQDGSDSISINFQDLQVGTWLDFLDKNGKVQSNKLSWVSPISQRFLFVNRRGMRFCVTSAPELEMMYRLGRVRLHSSDDAFDQAIHSVISQLDGDNMTLH